MKPNISHPNWADMCRERAIAPGGFKVRVESLRRIRCSGGSEVSARLLGCYDGLISSWYGSYIEAVHHMHTYGEIPKRAQQY